MNTDQIGRLLRGRCRIFRGVYASDELPLLSLEDRPIVIIANTDPKRKSGRHWVAMYFGLHSSGEYFDSFGMKPMPIFQRYMNSNCFNWKYNEHQLQSVISRFCAHYCIMYCIYKDNGYELNAFLKCYSSDTALNDYLVHKFVCKML
jgi:hypothetical protein